MALITRSTYVSIDAASAQKASFISGLFAGEALTAAAPCYIDTDGTVKMSTSASSVISTESKYIGFTADSVASGGPVTLFGKGTRFNYADSMTPGTLLFTSGSAGYLSDAAVLSGDIAPVAMAITETDIVVIR